MCNLYFEGKSRPHLYFSKKKLLVDTRKRRRKPKVYNYIDLLIWQQLLLAILSIMILNLWVHFLNCSIAYQKPQYGPYKIEIWLSYLFGYLSYSLRVFFLVSPKLKRIKILWQISALGINYKKLSSNQHLCFNCGFILLHKQR